MTVNCICWLYSFIRQMHNITLNGNTRPTSHTLPLPLSLFFLIFIPTLPLNFYHPPTGVIKGWCLSCHTTGGLPLCSTCLRLTSLRWSLPIIQDNHTPHLPQSTFILGVCSSFGENWVLYTSRQRKIGRPLEISIRHMRGLWWGEVVKRTRTYDVTPSPSITLAEPNGFAFIERLVIKKNQ